MNWLPDRTLAHLRDVADQPDLSDTRYELVERIGRGGMGAVYLAIDRALDRRVAVKVLHQPRVDEDAAVRMLKEAHILARLEHPGIVPVHDVGTLADGRIFYVMKHVEGSRLDAYVQQATSEADLLGIFERICAGVAFAHARMVIHRDLKPENIMVGRFGEVLVLDWGVAKLLSDPAVARSAAPGAARSQPSATNGEGATGTQEGTIIGTPGYMAPELLRGDAARADERTDIFALGALLRFMLNHAKRTPAPLNRLVPRQLEAICDKAAAPQPDERYASVEDLMDDLSRYREGLAVVAYPEGPFDLARRWVARYRTPILLVLTYLVIRLALLIVGRV